MECFEDINEHRERSEEEYEEIFADRLETLNAMIKNQDWRFKLDYAYFGVRLCKQKNGSSGLSDLSCRFYYDHDNTYECSDYEAFLDMLNTMINTMRAME